MLNIDETFLFYGLDTTHPLEEQGAIRPGVADAANPRNKCGV